jgi:hypothetical protein
MLLHAVIYACRCARVQAEFEAALREPAVPSPSDE